MSHTISHSAVLQASADELWAVSRHVDTIFCDLMPEFFAKSEFLQGYGEPGSIRWVTTGPAVKHATHLKERVDKFDDATKTLGYTILEGDPRYSAFSAEIHFDAVNETQAEATWTETFTPVGEMGPPENVKAIATLVFKTMEKAVHTMKHFTHTETLDVSPDAIWKACKHVDEILLTNLPQHFESSTMIHGHGGPGTVRVVKFGPAIPFAGEVTERMDFIDMESKKMGYTVLKGDPRFKLFAATMDFQAGPSDGTTTAVWNAMYMTVGDEDVPPLHVRDVVTTVWKTLAAAAKAHPERYAA